MSGLLPQSNAQSGTFTDLSSDQLYVAGGALLGNLTVQGTTNFQGSVTVNKTYADDLYTTHLHNLTSGSALAISADGSNAGVTIAASGSGFVNATSVLKATSGTASTTTATGALVVTGGAGVSGDAFIGGSVNTSLLTAATGNLVVSTGAGNLVLFPVGGNIQATAQLSQLVTTDSSSVGTGSIITAGGVGIAKALFVGGLANIAGALTAAATTDASSTTTGSIITAGGVGIAKKLYVGNSINATLTTDASSTTTGSIITSGGMGIAKKLYLGDGIFLPTSGGTAASFNRYELPTITGTCSGAGTPSFTMRIAVVGRAAIVTIERIDWIVNATSTLNIPAGTIPARLLPYSTSGSAVSSFFCYGYIQAVGQGNCEADVNQDGSVNIGTFAVGGPGTFVFGQDRTVGPIQMTWNTNL